MIGHIGYLLFPLVDTGNRGNEAWVQEGCAIKLPLILISWQLLRLLRMAFRRLELERETTWPVPVSLIHRFDLEHDDWQLPSGTRMHSVAADRCVKTSLLTRCQSAGPLGPDPDGASQCPSPDPLVLARCAGSPEYHSLAV